MLITETQIPDVLILETPVYRDSRGYFQETFRREALTEAGIHFDWKQDNVSVSTKNVIRGLHYQMVQPQAKLVRAVHGAVFDVAVDIRRTSVTFGRHVSIRLEAGDGKALLIPPGFAHGFAVLEADTVFLYKVDQPYYPQGDRTILWNDSQLGISWPLTESEALLSDKDRDGTPFATAEVFP